MKKTDFNITTEILNNPEKALRLEWLETNQIGGYSSSTVIGCNTRKYHGLLVCPNKDRPGRDVLLSKMLANVLVGNVEFHLSTNKFPSVFHPTGHRYMTNFEYASRPETTWTIGDIKIKESIMMPENENTVMIKYEYLEGEPNILLQLTPLLAYRNFNCLTKENQYLHVKTFQTKKGWKVEPYPDMPPIIFQTKGKAEYFPSPDWYRNLEYLKEQKRGYDFKEDLFSPGVFELKLKPGQDIIITATIEEKTGTPQATWDKEEARRKPVNASIKNELDLLKANAKHFILNENSPSGAGIIAGFPWFGEWGRDTMISLRGLVDINDKNKTFQKIMKNYGDNIANGLLPNQLGFDQSSASYNSVDAILWYFVNLQEIFNATKSKPAFMKEWRKPMEAFLDYYENNQPVHGIIDQDGFLNLGSHYSNLTWMDANVHGQPVTPRYGKCVEINGMWLNALAFLAEVYGADFAKSYPKLNEIKNKVLANFESTFFNKELGYLVDLINENGPDISVRPNQLIAAAMPFCPLKKSQFKSIFETAEKELLTPRGIRTLSPKNLDYKGWYEGSQEARDGAYHQGTVWPWLFGVYTDVAIKAAGKLKKPLKELHVTLMTSVQIAVYEFGLGNLAEIHSGDYPHNPKGCIAQAWSVAETLRAIKEVETKIK